MFDIRNGFKRSLTLTFTKSDGSPGEVEGVPVWSLSSGDLADLLVADDGMSAVISHNGSVGTTMLTISADGDLGVGVHPIEVTEEFAMMAPLGASVGILAVGDEEPI